MQIVITIPDEAAAQLLARALSLASIPIAPAKSPELPAQPPELRMLTLDEAARELRIANSTLREIVARGELAVIRYGRAVRVRSDALEAFIRERSVRKAERRQNPVRVVDMGEGMIPYPTRRPGRRA